jgi:cob(I)alamin adenosyltransferase
VTESTASYKKRMQLKKSYIDKRIKQANINKSLIVLLTGNGKGKSSSALGMIYRSLAYNMKVGVVKFLKGEQHTKEDEFLIKHKDIKAFFMKTGFTWDTQDTSYDTKKAIETWLEAEKLLQDENIDLVVLDELTYMLNYKYLDKKQVIYAIKNRIKKQHVIITGRAADKSLIDIADTVSEIKDIKHAFRDNIKAQKGIDY